MASKAGEAVGPALASAGAAVAAGAQQVGEVVVEAGQAVGEGASNLATAATSDGVGRAGVRKCEPLMVMLVLPVRGPELGKIPLSSACGNAVNLIG